MQGINLGLFNPTLPDIGELTSSTTFQMSTTLTITGIASVIGALAFGPLFDRFNGLLVLTIALLLEGLTIGLAPWCPHLIGYQIMVALTSVCNFGILAG
jgi:MFS family permease